MELRREREQIRREIAYWLDNKLKPEKTDKMKALDPETATRDDLVAIVGGNVLCKPDVCEECGTTTWDIVMLGGQIDYEYDVALICKDCLTKALGLFEKC